MKKIVVAGVAVIAALVLVGSGQWPLPSPETTDSGTPEPIVIRTTVQELAGLIYIAEDQGFFAQNGLNVTSRYCDTGLACVVGMADGEAEVAASAEYPVVGIVLKQGNISVIGCIDKYQLMYLVGRKDRGINDISDLKGKKIGVTRQSQAEFFLGRFLDLRDMSIQDITPVDLPPPQYVDAISNGSIDGIVAGHVHINPIKERLGSNMSIWHIQNSQPIYCVMVGRNDWIASHPEAINKFLKSLDQAEEYIINHPTEAKAIVQKRLNYSDAYMESAWPNHQFSLTLDQSLLIAMNDEGRWMINNNLTDEMTLSYFRDYIYTKGLEEVKPESVNIR